MKLLRLLRKVVWSPKVAFVIVVGLLLVYLKVNLGYSLMSHGRPAQSSIPLLDQLSVRAHAQKDSGTGQNATLAGNSDANLNRLKDEEHMHIAIDDKNARMPTPHLTKVSTEEEQKNRSSREEQTKLSTDGKKTDTVVEKAGSGPPQRVSDRLLSAFHSPIFCNETRKLDFLNMPERSVKLDMDPVCAWLKDTVINKDHSFVSYGGEMALLRDVTLDPTKLTGAKGGDTIEAVLKQKEGVEYFGFLPGAFTMPCSAPPAVNFVIGRGNYRRRNHLNDWEKSIVCRQETRRGDNATSLSPARPVGQTLNVTFDPRGLVQDDAVDQSPRGNVPETFVPGVTLAVTRYEYANVHHTLTDIYNAFMALLMLRINPRYATVLLVDGHPWGKFDAPWASLFGGRNVYRAGRLPAKTTFEYMVWIPVGYHSPIFLVELPQVSYLPELRYFFYRQYGVTPKEEPTCPKLHVLFVLRRDYRAHPRNPLGQIQRKIANEAEVTEALKSAGYVVHDVQLDLLPVGKQLEIVGQADIMLGMHGAGLTWSIFMHDKAGLVEIAPQYFQKHSQCFKGISRWRGFHHVHWTNLNSTNERANYHTYLPPDTVVGLVNQVRNKICNQTVGA